MKFRVIFAALPVLILLLSACTMPLSTLPSGSSLLATITAQVGAFLGSSSATPAAVPVTGGTGTPGVVQVSVDAPSNCRTGPSTEYDVVFVASPGLSYPVVGKYTASNYWIVVNPAGGTCWLWGQYAAVTGNVGSLPEYVPPAVLALTETPQAAGSTTPGAAASPTDTPAPPPTMTKTPTQAPTHAPPAPPTGLRASRTCTSGSDGTTAIWVEVVTLAWRDTSGELGYRIYEDGAAITTIAQNSFTYQIQLRYNQGASDQSSDNFGIEAYNTGGTSSRPLVEVPRCP